MSMFRSANPLSSLHTLNIFSLKFLLDSYITFIIAAYILAILYHSWFSLAESSEHHLHSLSMVESALLSPCTGLCSLLEDSSCLSVCYGEVFRDYQCGCALLGGLNRAPLSLGSLLSSHPWALGCVGLASDLFLVQWILFKRTRAGEILLELGLLPCIHQPLFESETLHRIPKLQSQECPMSIRGCCPQTP